MIIKPCTVPLITLTEEALLRRLPLAHQKRAEILASLQKGWSGFRGEQNLSYHLSFLPEREYLIFHDVRLVTTKGTCQIDVLVLTAQALFIIESKNFTGQVVYDQNVKRLVRTYQTHEESFPDPIMQAKRQRILLQIWMDEHKIKACPIKYLISIGPSTTMLKTNGSNQIFQKILHTEQIPDKIQQLNHSHQEKIFSPYLLQKFCDLLLESHTPLPINILEKYEIDCSELISGVQCPSCHNSLMIRLKNNWYCPQCKTTSQDAHHQAINDYLLIFGTMTNKQCREFLHIPSINVCTRILQKLDLPHSGKSRHKVYYRQ